MRHSLCKYKVKKGTDKIASRARVPSLFRSRVGGCLTAYTKIKVI